MRKILFIILSFSILAACSKDDDKVKTNGEVVLSSQLIFNGTSYTTEGFIIHEAKKVKYGLGLTPYPDLVLENIIDVNSSDVIGANLVSPQNDEAFYKAGEYADLADAEIAFENIVDAGSSSLTPTAPAVKANQIYVFKTRGNKYAKLLIRDYKISPAKDYVEITIKWVYQPSGETTFFE